MTAPSITYTITDAAYTALNPDGERNVMVQVPDKTLSFRVIRATSQPSVNDDNYQLVIPERVGIDDWGWFPCIGHQAGTIIYIRANQGSLKLRCEVK